MPADRRSPPAGALGALRLAGAALLAALLPSPEREDLERRHRVDAPFASFLVGLAELGGGGLWLVHFSLTFITTAGDRHQGLILGSWDPSREMGPEFWWSGILTWLLLLVQPAFWALAAVASTGLVRLLAFGLTREAVAEPLVWMGLRLFQLAARPVRAGAELGEYGPVRPDRLVAGENPGELVVLSAREKPEWNELVTIEVRERFFRLIGFEVRRDGPWKVRAYLLREADPAEVIRRLVRHEG